MKKILALGIAAMLVLVVLASCDDYLPETRLEFSFNTNASSNLERKKSIFFSEDIDILALNAELEISEGDITIQIIQNGTIIWDRPFDDNEIFTIKLENLKKDTEYSLVIFDQRAIDVKLAITSEHNVLQDKENLDRYIVEKNYNGGHFNG